MNYLNDLEKRVLSGDIDIFLWLRKQGNWAAIYPDNSIGHMGTVIPYLGMHYVSRIHGMCTVVEILESEKILWAEFGCK